jgi:hypothetical protein
MHGYGESLFNKWECRRLLAKTRFVEDLHKELTCVGENRASSILSRA